jgi:nitrite reductase/ring-hydroxylating ferredoxin subunit
MAEETLVAFCRVSELKRRRRITKWMDQLRDELTALYIDNEIIVTSSVCFHNGGEFDVDWQKCQFRCRWHDWRFDIKTGESLSYSLPGRRLQHYTFQVKDDQLLIPLTQ